jgi:hypothetical protein
VTIHDTPLSRPRAWVQARARLRDTLTARAPSRPLPQDLKPPSIIQWLSKDPARARVKERDEKSSGPTAAPVRIRGVVYRLQLLTILLATLTVSLVILAASSCNEDHSATVHVGAGK